MPARFARILVLAALALATTSARAQHEGHEEHETQSPSVLPPHQRTGSGTSWLPDASPMHAVHARVGDWTFMIHGNVSAGINHQAGDRGDTQLTVLSWLMGMASHPLFGGDLTLRAMLSADPATLPGDGYPLLLQTGESWDGAPLHDRQHPHDVFMELAALQRFVLGSELGLEVYLAPVGEPAIGPTAFMHRLSASSDPVAPLGHHWQDSTHITFGVITAGVFGRRWKLEGSWFNGREPDERRYDFDFRVPDSYSARFTLNPGEAWSAQASWAYLDSPEGLHPDESVHRVTTSVSYTALLGEHGYWASTLVGGYNIGGHDEGASVLLESNLDLDGHHVFYGRAEVVEKSAAALVLTGLDEDRRFLIASLALGYQLSLGPWASLTPALGVRGSVSVVPSEVGAFHGTEVPLAILGYLQVRPAAMRMSGGHAAHESMPPEHGPDVAPAEAAAYERARPVFEQHCASCHQREEGQALTAALRHFDMTTYPLAGHHTHEISATIRRVLGAAGAPPTMPRDRPGAVQGEDLERILAWADAYDRAHASGPSSPDGHHHQH